MKRLLFLSFLIMCSMVSYAQTGLIYQGSTSGQNGFTYGGNNVYNNQSNSQIVRTTAYFMNQYDGNVYKVPIKVQIMDSAYGGGTQMQVIEEYRTNAFGGNWTRIGTGGSVRKCQSMYGGNSLENSFMFKAYVGTNWYYFDL